MPKKRSARAIGRRIPKRAKRPLMTYGAWSAEFVKDAEADQYQLIEEYGERVIGASGLGEDIIEATLLLVAHLCGYEICGPDFEDKDLDRLLRTQHYDMRKIRKGYTIAVETSGAPVPARVLARQPDFVDLEDFHYARGLEGLMICHTDYSRISAKEKHDIEAFVRESFDDAVPLKFVKSSQVVVVHVCGEL